MSAAKYERLVRRTQAEARIPALSVALHRADRPMWTCQVGASGTDRDLDRHTRFRIGSVTKTFTAVLVMQCRDDGLLDLDDPIAAHLPVPAHGSLTVARLLSHTSGLQREPFGDVWDTLRPPAADELLAQLDRAEQVLPAGRRYHYSNLAFAVLGNLAARLRGGTFAEVVGDRVLEPLGLDETGVPHTGDAAVGYLVDSYSDQVRAEPAADFGGVAPTAQLWSTAADMSRWAAFLADPRSMDPNGTVLAASTVDEMRWPRTLTDETQWHTGFGLGLILVPHGDPREGTVHVGHDGAMPGFLAAVYGRSPNRITPEGFGAAVLGSSGTAHAMLDLPHELLAAAVQHDPVGIEPWTPDLTGPPERYRSVLGRWWAEGFEHVFGWHDGTLQARDAERPSRPAVFAPIEGQPDVLRTIAGREVGELLRLTRDEHGTVVKLHWATYRFTRTKETFSRETFF